MNKITIEEFNEIYKKIVENKDLITFEIDTTKIIEENKDKPEMLIKLLKQKPYLAPKNISIIIKEEKNVNKFIKFIMDNILI